MNNTQVSQDLNMLCLGSPIPPALLEQLKAIDKPDIPDVQWVQPRNLFISHQDFFRMKPNYDIKKLLGSIQTEILHKYFPMILMPRELSLIRNSGIPKSLEWNLAVSSIKDTRLDLHTMRMMINKDMESVLKDACLSFQSIKFDPSIKVARIAKSAKDDPRLKDLELIKIPSMNENIVINKLMLIKVTKDDFGLNYEYITIDE